MSLQINGYIVIPEVSNVGTQIITAIKPFRKLTFTYTQSAPISPVTAYTELVLTIVRSPISINDPGVPVYWLSAGTETITVSSSGVCDDIVLSRPGSYYINAQEIDTGNNNLVIHEYNVYLEVLSFKDLTTSPFPTETVEFEMGSAPSAFNGWSRKVESTVQYLSFKEDCDACVGIRGRSETDFDLNDLVYIQLPAVGNEKYPEIVYDLKKTDFTAGGCEKRSGIIIDYYENTATETYEFPNNAHSEACLRMFLVAFKGKFVITNPDFTDIPVRTDYDFVFLPSTGVLTNLAAHSEPAIYIGKYYHAQKILIIENNMQLTPEKVCFVYFNTPPSGTPWRSGLIWAVQSGSQTGKVYISTNNQGPGDWSLLN